MSFSPHTLSLRQKVAQLIVVRASGHLFDRQIAYPQWEAPQATLRHWIEDLGVGGVILLGGSAAEVALRTQQLQSWTSPGSGIPLLIAADVEEGVGQRFAGATALPPPLALGDLAAQDLPAAIALAREYGAIIAQEAAAIGLNWVLAPVVDVNNNPLNPVINLRAFGETPEVVRSLTQAFIVGCQDFPVLTTAKHFPGHGDTTVDSHLDLPQIPHDRTRLEAVEWVPFRGAIEAQVSSIMTAHVAFPALDPLYPATLSPHILEGILRQAWGFEGLIVTDALVMQAITQRYGAAEAAVLAVAAGADVVLMPSDPEQALEAIVTAVETGRLSIDRIDQSLHRLAQAKAKVTTPVTSADPAQKLSVLPALSILESPKGESLSRRILERSQRVRGVLPTVSAPGENLIWVDNVLQAPFLTPQSPALKIPAPFGYQNRIFDRHSHPGEFPIVPHTLLQLFVRGNPFRGSGTTAPWMQERLQHLLDHHCLDAVVVYGSPYAWDILSAHFPPDLPCVFSYGQIPLAQEIALQALFAPGLSNNGKQFKNSAEFTT